MNRTFVFDAVGTLLRPIPDVITAYQQAGLRHGSSLDRQEVAARFKIARRRYFNCDTSAEGPVAVRLFPAMTSSVNFGVV